MKSKAAFVRSLSKTLTAKEVVAKAKAAGIKLSTAYVYVLRSKSSGPKRGKPGPKPKGDLDQQFLSVALDLGIGRASELLGKIRSAAHAAVEG